MGFGGFLYGNIHKYLAHQFLYHLEVFVSIPKTANLMPIFSVRYNIHKMLTVKLLSESRPLLHEILNIVLNFSIYGKFS